MRKKGTSCFLETGCFHSNAKSSSGTNQATTSLKLIVNDSHQTTAYTDMHTDTNTEINFDMFRL